MVLNVLDILLIVRGSITTSFVQVRTTFIRRRVSTKCLFGGACGYLQSFRGRSHILGSVYIHHNNLSSANRARVLIYKLSYWNPINNRSKSYKVYNMLQTGRYCSEDIRTHTHTSIPIYTYRYSRVCAYVAR